MDLSKYSHILWDWNGTLLDDAWLCVEIINRFLATRNLPTVSLERYRSVFTFPVQRYYEALGFNFLMESWERISTEFITQYEGNRSRCHLMPDAAAVLNHIASLGLHQSILSASKLEYLEKAVIEYGLKDLFFALNGLDNHHAAGKVEMGVEFLKNHAITPAEVLLIGDTAHDFEVATFIGADCCLVSNGHQSADRLVGDGIVVYGNLSEFLSELKAAPDT